MVDLTPSSVIETLTSIGRDLDGKAAEIEQLDADAVRLRALYRREFARNFLGATGSNDIRRYQAEVATADLWQEVELADQVLRAAKEAIRVLRDRLDIGRSLNTVLRMEWGNS
jgi:hypothetical protein